MNPDNPDSGGEKSAVKIRESFNHSEESIRMIQSFQLLYTTKNHKNNEFSLLAKDFINFELQYQLRGKKRSPPVREGSA
jgi:hypothetical protein